MPPRVTEEKKIVIEGSDPKQEKLVGATNYLGWSKLLKMELADRKYMNEDGFVSSTSEKACSLIMKNISLNIAAMIPDDEGPEVMWDWLKSQYGADDTFLLKKNLKNVQMENLDLDDFWNKYNMALAVYKSAGGKISYEDQLEILLENIDVEFFLDVIRKIRLDRKGMEIDSKTFLFAKNAIKDFYNATPQKIRNNYKKFEMSGKIQENSNYTFNSKNVCEWCQKHGRTKIQHTHKTVKCFYGDKSSSTKFNKNSDQNYFVAFHDSGSTPRSYFKDIPNNCKRSNSFVQTANNQKIPVVGTGSVKFGNMELNDVAYVPSFTKNLVSGIQIMNQGYKQIMENGKLKITKNGILVATGKYDNETGLIKMDTEIRQNSNYCRTEQKLNFKNIHSRLGHPGNILLQKTLDATDGLKINQKIQNEDCEICLQTKTKKLNIRKKGSVPNNYLEVIESDTQGPFPIIAADGTRNNVKFVDKKSRYTKMFTIPNREIKIKI